MLRVCGITYDHTVNYGSCLQAYALQTAVSAVRLSDGTECSYQLIPIRAFKDWPQKQKLTVQRLLVLPFIHLFRARFSAFEKEKMRFAPVSRLNELPSLNRSADAFVCGSDVIWNPDLNFNLKAFYLDFAEKYKFSYSASFGKADVSEKTMAVAKEQLPSFNAISVRELSGAEVVERCIGAPAKIVADPVLLLTKEDWDATLPPARSEGKYIFVYITHLSRSVQNYLNALQKETGLKIVYAAAGPKQAIKQGMLLVQKPDRWLQQLRDAEYVVTNSFHATAFSVLFHKKFFTVVNGDKAGGINVRMNDFLNAVGLGDRIFSDLPETIDLSEIDYSGVDKKLAALREESQAFLRENLEAAYQAKKAAEAAKE